MKMREAFIRDRKTKTLLFVMAQRWPRVNMALQLSDESAALRGGTFDSTKPTAHTHVQWPLSFAQASHIVKQG